MTMRVVELKRFLRKLADSIQNPSIYQEHEKRLEEINKRISEEREAIYAEYKKDLSKPIKKGGIEELRFSRQEMERRLDRNSEIFSEIEKNNYLSLVMVLLQAGADVHANNDYLLCWAAENGDFELAVILLQNGANVEAGDGQPLRWAARKGLTNLVTLLLEKGADVHAREDMALREAAEYGQAEVVKVLLAAGAHTHDFQNYALRWAAENGHLEVVKILVVAGSDLHDRGEYALRHAAKNGHFEVVEYLLAMGADVHIWDDEPIRRAAEYSGDLRVIKLLLEAGANPYSDNHFIFRRALEMKRIPQIVTFLSYDFEINGLSSPLLVSCLLRVERFARKGEQIRKKISLLSQYRRLAFREILILMAHLRYRPGSWGFHRAVDPES